jgi:hypothetical protein
MKLRLTSLLVAFGLITNAAFSGNSARIGYASDFFYRGAQKAEQSVQSSLKLGSSVAGLGLSAHGCTNQAIDTGVDSYHLGAGAGKSFSDGLLSVYAGINHFEDRPGNALSEFEVGLSSNTLLSPSVSVFRDFDDSLYTVEVGVSHDIDVSVATLGLDASAGNTDLTSNTDRTYYSVGANLSKSVSENSDLSVGVDYIDADDIDREFVFGAGLTFKF